MEEKSRSYLLTKVGMLLGFGWIENAMGSAELSIYKVGAGYVICLSHGDGQECADTHRLALGQLLPGSVFAAFAQRMIEGMSYAELRKIIEDCYPETKFEWKE